MDSAELLDLLGNANRRRILRLLADKPCYVTEISEYIGVSPKAVIDHLGKLEQAGLVESSTDDRRRKYFSIARNLRLEVQVSPYEFGTKSAYPTSRGFDINSCRYVSLEVASHRRSDDGGDGDASDDVDGGSEDRSEEVAGEGAVGEGEPSEDAVSEDLPDESATSEDGDGEGGDSDGEGGEGDELGDVVAELVRLQQLGNELSLAQRWVQARATEVREELGEVVEDDVDGGRLYAEVVTALANGPRDAASLGRAVEAPPRLVREVLETLSRQGIVEQRGDGWHLVE